MMLIEDNHIHHINTKQQLAGAEIGGIKMHAAIDTIFRRNHIHHCTEYNEIAGTKPFDDYPTKE